MSPDHDPNSDSDKVIVNAIEHIMYEPPGEERWFEVEDVYDALKKMGRKSKQPSISTRIRDLRKSQYGQYPVHTREYMLNDERIFEYRLGIKGTGILNKKKKCKNCEAVEHELAKSKELVRVLRKRLYGS